MKLSGQNVGALRLKVYQDLKDRILCLELKPGEKVSENEWARVLGVSRTPVREALVMLQNENLVEWRDGRGFTVRRFTAKDVEEYFAVRQVIENFALELIVNRITHDDMRTINESLQHATRVIQEGDLHAIVRCETEFHSLLYRAARSDVLFDTVSRLVDKFQWLRAIALSLPGAATSSVEQHRAIVDLIERKDLAGVRELMSSHLQEAKEGVTHLLRLYV